MSVPSNTYCRTITPHDTPYLGFFSWLWMFMGVYLTARKTSYYKRLPTSRAKHHPNRRDRLFLSSNRKISPVHSRRPLRIMSRRGMTPTQFMERTIKVMGLARHTVYRMRYWRKTNKGKAAPLGMGCGANRGLGYGFSWPDPLNARTTTGLWDGHIWPSWQIFAANNCNKNNAFG